MATARKIHIDPQDTGLWKIKQTDESAEKASQLLQHDLETHHVYYNDRGFHNHSVHHVLSLFGTGAPPAALQRGYDDNASYQRPARPLQDAGVVAELEEDWARHAPRYMGIEAHYPAFLAFFQRAIDARGWEPVVAEYLLSGTELADDLLVRMHAVFLHPLIQLMYGLEWRQPAIVAEALAQACVHAADLKEVLLESERRAREESGKMPKVVSLLEEVKADEKLRTAVRMEDGDLVRNGLLKRAPDELMRVISKVKVRPEEVEERTAEMFDAVLFMAAAASFHGEKSNKFDFFFMHHVNAAPIYLTINNQPWIPTETKARLLEWKIRYDLKQYPAGGTPDLSLNAIKNYQPEKAPNASLADILSRLHNFEDDGHAIKLARAAVLCQQVSKKYEDRDWMVLKGEDLWMKIHHLIADSVEAPGPVWVRFPGLDEAWTDVPNKAKP